MAQHNSSYSLPPPPTSFSKKSGLSPLSHSVVTVKKDLLNLRAKVSSPTKKQTARLHNKAKGRVGRGGLVCWKEENPHYTVFSHSLEEKICARKKTEEHVATWEAWHRLHKDLGAPDTRQCMCGKMGASQCLKKLSSGLRTKKTCNTTMGKVIAHKHTENTQKENYGFKLMPFSRPSCGHRLYDILMTLSAQRGQPKPYYTPGETAPLLKLIEERPRPISVIGCTQVTRSEIPSTLLIAMVRG